MKKLNIFWFRRDLRLQDNAGLYYSLQDDFPVLPIFIFDKNILDQLEDKSDARVTFIHDSITHLHMLLGEKKSGLSTFYNTPEDVFSSLAEEYDIQSVYTNRDYEPYATRRDGEIELLLKSKGIQFFTFKDQVIFERGEILNGKAEPYKVFTPYKNQWLKKYSESKPQGYQSEAYLHNLAEMTPLELISLQTMGFNRSKIPLPKADVNHKIIENYGNNRDYPSIDGTSRLGVHFRFGTLSIRHAVKIAYKHSDVWLSELIWREFYMMILAHFPHVVDKAFKSQYDRIPWLNDERHFQRWCDGKTGYPMVDAGMRELNATGYMHNRVRMVVASFLTKHLLIDWRWGEAYFAQKLLDFELASNNGGWQWAAGTGTDAQPYFRVFNPESQLKKFDQELAYVKKWVSEYGSTSYAEPIVEHKFARQRAIQTYKAALA